MSLTYLITPVCVMIFEIAILVMLILWCCKRRQQQKQQQQQSIVNVENVPPTVPPAEHQLSNPNYQPVPVSPPNGGLPLPSTPPPSYQEATYPGYRCGTENTDVSAAAGPKP